MREPAPAAAPLNPIAHVQPREPEQWTLGKVLERIAAENPTLAGAQARLAQAQAASSEARAGRWPELSLGIDAMSTDQPSMAFALLLDRRRVDLAQGFDPTPGSTQSWHQEVRLDWALFAPGRSQGIEAAGEGERATEMAALAMERRLLNAGIQGWIGLGAARALEEVARESVDVVERRLEVTALRQQEGAALRSDVLRLEAGLAAARQDAVRARQVAREAEAALNVLMGRSAREPLELAAEEDVELHPPEDLDVLLARAGSGRLELRSAAHQVRMLGHLTSAAEAARLPSLEGFARYGFDGGDPWIESDQDSYAAGVSLRLPFSARTGARIEQARAREREARQALRELSLDLTREVRDAWEALAVARESLDLARHAVAASEEAFRMLSEAQDAGGATVTDVLEAEDARRQARGRQVAAAAGVRMARARILAAIGEVP